MRALHLFVSFVALANVLAVPATLAQERGSRAADLGHDNRGLVGAGCDG